MSTTPHWLRFAQALALVSGVTACGGTASTGTNSAANDQGTSGGTAGGATGGGTTVGGGTADPCPCTCDGSSVNPPYCGNVGHYECCETAIMVGPLSPPDLPT